MSASHLLQSASNIARALRDRQLSSRELTTELFDRIDALNPQLKAVVETRRDFALASAEHADLALARDDSAALTGVPMTIKDAFDVSGMHNTWGNPEFAGFVAEHDAEVVQRLQRNGAIIAGRTNVASMLADFGQSDNPVYGITKNPWNLAYAPGGSSGGAAAAIASGLSFLEFGSDVVGSIRIPASFCGVYGLKPSVNTVPLAGFQPPHTPDRTSEMLYMSSIGPIARSATDLRVALQVTGGPTLPTSNAYSWKLAPPRHRAPKEFRVGIVLDDAFCRVTPDVGAVLSDAIDALAKTGARITTGWPDGVDAKRSFDAFNFHVQLFMAFQQPGDNAAVAKGFMAQERERMHFRAAWARHFEHVDVFLCPVNFTAAFPHDARPFAKRTIATPNGERPYTDQSFWVSHASLPGLPALSAPVGLTPSRLPVGLQVIGPLHEDDTIIAFAEHLADVVGGYEPPPIAR